MSLLEVNNLCASFSTPAGEGKALNGVSFRLDRRKALGLVGESGSGKSVTALSLMGLWEKTAVSGSILFDGQELVNAGERVLRQLRGSRIALVSGNPMTALNPTRTIGSQILETLRLHGQGAQARERAVEALGLVEIGQPERRMRQYPHELDAGTRQRVSLAIALACTPDLLIADDPAAGLDLTEQARILDILKRVRENTAVLFLTRDFGAAVRLCDETAVLYAGSICEQGTAEDLFYYPKHEYTKTLLRSIPTQDTAGRRLHPAPSFRPAAGSPVDPLRPPQGCPFALRCASAMRVCLRERCTLTGVGGSHRAACWLNRKPVSPSPDAGKPKGPSLEDGPGAGVMFPGTFTDGRNGYLEKIGLDEKGGTDEKSENGGREVPIPTDAEQGVPVPTDANGEGRGGGGDD